jgi:3-oxoacyl-[acyl-carrier protein] reductase
VIDLGLRGRAALVAGSTSGLGLAVAQVLGREHANVALCGRRASIAAQRATELPSAIGVELDLTKPATVDDAVARTLDAFGRIDVLVLNAGGPPPGPATELTPQNMAEALETLLLAQVNLVSMVLPGMRSRRWGRILAIGSSGVQQPIPHLVRSNVARAGLAAYLKTLAGEVAQDGITVNMILPGRIDTDHALQVLAAVDQIIDHVAYRMFAVLHSDALVTGEWSAPVQRDGLVQLHGPVITYGPRDEPWAPADLVELSYRDVADLRYQLATGPNRRPWHWRSAWPTCSI